MMAQETAPHENHTEAIADFDAKLVELTELEEHRVRLIGELALDMNIDDRRSATILAASVHIEEQTRLNKTPGLTRHHSPVEVAAHLGAFEAAVADPKIPVLYLHHDFVYKSNRLHCNLIQGSITYPGPQRFMQILRPRENDDLDINISHVIEAQYERFAAEDKKYIPGVYVGTKAIESLLLKMQPAPDEQPHGKLWDIATIRGVVAASGVDICAESEAVALLFEKHQEFLEKHAEKVLRNNIVLTISDEHEQTGAPSKPQKTKQSSGYPIWDRDKEETRLLTQTIPALKALGLGDIVLATVDTIDKPVIKESTAVPGMMVEAHFLDECFPKGLSEIEAIRRTELREKITTILA